jgi:hypothetical protein
VTPPIDAIISVGEIKRFQNPRATLPNTNILMELPRVEVCPSVLSAAIIKSPVRCFVEIRFVGCGDAEPQADP